MASRRARLPAEVMAALVAYDWPGNVRALRHAAERAVILAGDDAFTVEDFSLVARSAAPRQRGDQHRRRA